MRGERADGGAPAVRVRGLVRRFGPVTAVDDVSFEVARGELFGIVGPDGAGKTTMLRVLAGVLRPGAGVVEVDGTDVVADPEAAKPHLAYMAQRFGLYEDLTVRENLDFYAALYGVPRVERPARLERLYRMSRLGEFESRLAGRLSGGMKQKLSLSCALVHRPRLLLLDEPTFGVDPISRRELWVILHEMVAEGITVVVSTSYLDEAERCDRVLLLHEGRALALDRPEGLQRSLAGRLLAVLGPNPRRAVEALRAVRGVTSATRFGDEVHVLVPSAPDRDASVPAAALAEALAAAGLGQADIAERLPSLEDVFLERVKEAEGAGA